MKERGKLQRLLFILCFGLLIIAAGRTMRLAAAEGDEAEKQAEPVKVVKIDYDELWIEVDPGENTAVYYSDKAKKVWSEAMKGGTTAENYLIDISWLKLTSATEITLKGDVNEDIVSVNLPARESKYKIKFDKAKGVLTFTSVPLSIEKIQWRKATSYQWNEVSIEDAKNPESDFAKEIEKLRVAGASIYVRTAGVDGKVENGTLNVGVRPGKEIKVSITKFASAPKIKINGAKLTLNTTNSMEYSLDNKEWKDAKKTMSIADVAPKAVAETSPEAVTVFFRKKATSKAPHSKTFVLEIPAQPSAPSESDVTTESKDGKFYLDFKNASKQSPYEYTVVKSGKLDEAKASWKSVVTAKQISVSEKTAPKGSIIYVRKKTVKQTTTADFQLASATYKIEVQY